MDPSAQMPISPVVFRGRHLGAGASRLCRWSATTLVLAVFGARVANAQAFRIESVVLTNGNLRMLFPGRGDSYFFLNSATSVTGSQLRVAAVLGNSGNQSFVLPISSNASAFLRVERLPITGDNDQDADGIPDAWELSHGINPLAAGDAAGIVPGEGRTWLQKYLDEPPQFSFANAGSTNLVTASLIPVQVNFSKPFGGGLRVQLGGTALLNLDYFIVGSTLVSTNPPVIALTVPAGSISTLIPIQPVNDAAVAADRTITVSLVAPADDAYQLSTNAPVTHVAILTETSLMEGGLLAGTLSTSNSVLLEAQALRVALRPGAGGQMNAYFDATRAPLFGSPFSLRVAQSAGGLQFQGETSGAFPTNTVPPGSAARWAFSLPQSSTDTNGAITSQFVLQLIGLTATGRTNTARGTITFAPLN